MEKKKILLILGVAIVSGFFIWDNVSDRIRQARNGTGETNKLTLGVIPSEKRESAVPSQTIDLQDGQTLDLFITPVQKIIAGKTVRMLGYNGSIPGPTLRVPEGAEITINLKNGGDIGTTLHAHGVRMDNAFDGVPGVTQNEIAPGETFAYKLKFSDPGIYWYHPHVRTDYTLESGLYANIIVTPKDASYWPPVNREIPLMLDDIALDKNDLLPFDANTSNHTLMGRFGDVMLIHGETSYEIQAKEGEVVRLYLTNAANTRLFNFALPGVRMKLVGADGGRYEKETFVDSVLVAPGERRVVDVFFEKAGQYTMKHQTPNKGYMLGQVSVSADTMDISHANEFLVLRNNRVVADELENLMNVYLGKTPDKKLNLSLDMTSEMRKGMPSGMHSMGGMTMSDSGMDMGDDGDALEWEDTMAEMNRASNSNMMSWKLVDSVTNKTNMDINDWNFRLGEKVKVRIFNEPTSMHPMQHPIHFHGQRFMVLSTNGMKNVNPVWMDTTLIAKGDTVDILLDITNPGDWVAHCHILEHAESGMMLPFMVR